MTKTDILNPLEIEDEDTLKGKYLVFSLGKEMYGMEIRYITEIIGIQPITEVPEMPKYVKGITNLRGKIIPIMDARLCFRKEIRKYDGRTCIIVLEIDDISIGLIVDSVVEVLTMQDEDISSPPDVGKGHCNYIKGIGKVGGSIILLLDCQKLLTDDELEEINASL